MNATEVLKRIMTTLSLSKEEVLFTYAKLADGTILESSTFDVGESVDVVTEDGKSPAPAGEHEVILRDSEGNDVRIKIIVDSEGKITERENVELQSEEEVAKEEEIEEMVAGLIDTLTPDEVSSEVAEDIAEKVLDALEDKIEILKKRKATKMESIAGGDMGDDEEVATEETAEPISEDEDMKSILTKLQYRIEELEKKYKKMAEVKEEEISEGEDAEIVKVEPLPGDVAMKAAKSKVKGELPKLDGAPIDENAPKQNGVKFNKKGNVANTQNSFLSKLYK
jgi:hypothetical protein